MLLGSLGRIAKGGRELRLSPGGRLHTSTGGRGLCCTPSALRVPMDATPPSRPWWLTRNQLSHVWQCSCILGHGPCPQHTFYWALPKGKCWFLPVSTKMTTAAKVTRSCFLEDNCIWTRIVLINSPNKKFLKQKFQYNKAQGPVGAVLKIRRWRHSIWTALFQFCSLTMWPWQGTSCHFASTSLSVLGKIIPTHRCQHFERSVLWAVIIIRCFYY